MHAQQHLDALAVEFPHMDEAEARQVLTPLRGYVATATLMQIHPRLRDTVLDSVIAQAAASRGQFNPDRKPKNLPPERHSPYAALRGWVLGIARRTAHEVSP